MPVRVVPDGSVLVATGRRRERNLSLRLPNPLHEKVRELTARDDIAPVH
jgi:hypothetical protein